MVENVPEARLETYIIHVLNEKNSDENPSKPMIFFCRIENISILAFLQPVFRNQTKQ
jgi:hypothetical protein